MLEILDFHDLDWDELQSLVYNMEIKTKVCEVVETIILVFLVDNDVEECEDKEEAYGNNGFEEKPENKQEVNSNHRVEEKLEQKPKAATSAKTEDENEKKVKPPMVGIFDVVSQSKPTTNLSDDNCKPLPENATI